MDDAAREAQIWTHIYELDEEKREKRINSSIDDFMNELDLILQK